MSDLSREQIEKLRAATLSQSSSPRERAGIGALFDMALRTHDAEQRAQRAEAECERLREGVRAVRDDIQAWGERAWNNSAAAQATRWTCDLDTALATPPPEPDDRVEAAYWDGRSDERKRWEPEQAHGDAPQPGTVWECLDCLYRMACRDNPWPAGIYEREIRNHLTASGVPEEVRRLQRQVEWLEANSVLRNPHQHPISEYLETKDETEPVCPGSERGVHSEAWYDGERCSICGAPHAPDKISDVSGEVWRLPNRWRKNATENEHIGNHAAACRFKCCADELERALASAPAVPKFPAGWKVNRAEKNRITIQHPKIGFAVLTNESDDNPRVTIAYELIDAMIESAPTDGRE